jgi:hypothetical protein
MTTHAHDTEGTGPGAEPRRPPDDYPGERDPFAQPEGAGATASMPGATTQPLAREDVPNRPRDDLDPREDTREGVPARARDDLDRRQDAREGVPARPTDDVDLRDGDFQTPAADSNPTRAPQAPTPEASTADDALFPAADLAGLRTRWNDVQAGFVDDPRRCVETADGLVSDLVQQLAGGFAHARSRLEDQWSRGEDVSTEDLRLALKRYREFFERLLAV